MKKTIEKSFENRKPIQNPYEKEKKLIKTQLKPYWKQK